MKLHLRDNTSNGSDEIYTVIDNTSGVIGLKCTKKRDLHTSYHYLDVDGTEIYKKMENLVLIADDDESLRRVFAAVLEKAGYHTVKARNGKETLAVVQKVEADVILLDIFLGDANGLELIAEIQKYNKSASIIIVTAHGTTQTAIDAAKQRAYGYLTKPVDTKQLLDLVGRAASASNQTKHAQTSQLPVEIERQGKIVGQSSAMQAVYQLIGRAAVSDETVLILGESGTGKELVSQLIHRNSPRADNPFVIVDCGAIPPTLIESALFGHVKGAYTDARTARTGKFEQADGGTIFLDEIGELPAEVQMKLLRVLQEREVEPVGSNERRTVNVRIIAATNRHLKAAVEQKEFREDLYYRLNVVPIVIPPLRERKEDIPELVDLFTSRFVEEYKLPHIGISTAAMEQLTVYEWPGNVRELENAIKRSLVMCSGQMLLPEHFTHVGRSSQRDTAEQLSTFMQDADFDEQVYALLYAQVERYLERETEDGELYAEIRAIFEKPLFKIVLEHTKKNQSKAAKLLGINRNTLHTKLIEYELT